MVDQHQLGTSDLNLDSIRSFQLVELVVHLVETGQFGPWCKYFQIVKNFKFSPGGIIRMIILKLCRLKNHILVGEISVELILVLCSGIIRREQGWNNIHFRGFSMWMVENPRNWSRFSCLDNAIFAASKIEPVLYILFHPYTYAFSICLGSGSWFGELIPFWARCLFIKL